MRLRSFLPLLLLLLTFTARAAAPPTLLLDVARFRTLEAGDNYEVEIYVTVPGNGLTYIRRAPGSYQAAAAVTLQVLKADGKPAHTETISIRPPVVSDTSMEIKNPQSFLRRLTLPAGQYTVRGELRDTYKKSSPPTKIELPLALDFPKNVPALSDVVFLGKAAAASPGQSNFARGGYLLTRAPGGMYSRGSEQLYFYAEAYQLPKGQPVKLHYHIESKDGATADADAALDSPKEGRPTPITGEIPLGPLPSGDYTLTVQVRGAGNKVLATRTAQLSRTKDEYSPGGASLPR